MFRGFLFVVLVTGQTVIRHNDFETLDDCLTEIRHISQQLSDQGHDVIGVCRSHEEILRDLDGDI